MNVFTVLIIYPAALFIMSLTTIYNWGVSFAFIMGAISAYYFSYLKIATKGTMGDGSNINPNTSFVNMLSLSIKPFFIILAYLLLAAYIVHYCHANQVF